MKRLEQLTLITTFAAFCWLGMQAVHELGHILAARCTGGKIVTVVLYPTTISRTEVFPNPHPLIEVWAGPILGSLFPLAAFALAMLLRSPGIYLCRFFAGFCLVANGGYLIAGAVQIMGDPGELIRHGASRPVIVLVGGFFALTGFILWNRLGSSFGMGKAGGKVDRKVTVVSLVLFIVTVGGELVFSHP